MHTVWMVCLLFGLEASLQGRTPSLADYRGPAGRMEPLLPCLRRLLQRATRHRHFDSHLEGDLRHGPGQRRRVAQRGGRRHLLDLFGI
jgi:hypothetical protein